MKKFHVKSRMGFMLFLMSFSGLSWNFPSPVTEEEEFEWVKTGGFEVESLAPVELYDYHPGMDSYLGFINMFSKGIEIAVIDGDGDILVQKKLEGEGPEQYPGSLLSFGFTEEGEVWMHTTVQLLLYDKELNFKWRKKYNPGVMVNIYPGPRSSFPYFYQEKGQDTPSFITPPSSVSKSLGSEGWTVDKTNLLEIYDGMKGEIYEMAPLRERAHYKGFDKRINNQIAAVYALDRNKNELYLTTRFDNEITVYDLRNNQVVRRIPIQHESFNSLKQLPITAASLPSYKNNLLFAFNSKIFKFEGSMLGLMYTKEISEAAYVSRREDDPKYSQINDPEFKRMIVFEDGKQISGDLKLPYGDVKTALPDNKILVKMMDSEEEEDVIRYGIYQLVRK